MLCFSWKPSIVFLGISMDGFMNILRPLTFLTFSENNDVHFIDFKQSNFKQSKLLVTIVGLQTVFVLIICSCFLEHKRKLESFHICLLQLMLQAFQKNLIYSFVSLNFCVNRTPQRIRPMVFGQQMGLLFFKPVTLYSSTLRAMLATSKSVIYRKLKQRQLQSSYEVH
ncbi:uncharacterized protein LOC107848602 [Capsicum annuum]|uniref:uncharacterized protein LOC107848602 n=1 Tax=Capsicum annuum TaxID=4072 RepID=UPI0007BEE19D|nr:uncharacterized protein LOC107848602 [Capsicum annuum]